MSIKFHISGFGEFHGVKNNPTEVLVRKLQEALKTKPLQDCVCDSTTIFETSAVGALGSLTELLMVHKVPQSEHDKLVFIHFGVNSKIDHFNIETVGWNEATFRCPDQQGWCPQSTPIISKNGTITHKYASTLDLVKINDSLSAEGYLTQLSTDPGRFLCNYLYYYSLHLSIINRTHSLFVHVPPFSVIPEEIQMKFIQALLNTISQTLSVRNQ